MPEKLSEIPPLPADRKLKVCLDYPQAPEITDERFELVETGEEADIVWTRQSFKDYRCDGFSFELKCTHVYQTAS